MSFMGWSVNGPLCQGHLYLLVLQDADLIILSLATHEPHFRVLREDVFAQDSSSNACRKCGEDGHYAAQCTAALNGPIVKPKPTGPPAKKPFIFLDVPTLREYLEIELNLPYLPFPFDVERAIDDWVLLIFFVGNDFLPHLPSLEIREGAIDTLLKIWKDELPRMGGYLTNNGRLELARVELMFHGLASREDDIFRRRREGSLNSFQFSRSSFRLVACGHSDSLFACGRSRILFACGRISTLLYSPAGLHSCKSLAAHIVAKPAGCLLRVKLSALEPAGLLVFRERVIDPFRV